VTSRTVSREASAATRQLRGSPGGLPELFVVETERNFRHEPGVYSRDYSHNYSHNYVE
jgi:hypothetical protein